MTTPPTEIYKTPPKNVKSVLKAVGTVVNLAPVRPRISPCFTCVPGPTTKFTRVRTSK